MNPSAAGWINKFGSLITKDTFSDITFDALYASMKRSGFIYGVNIEIPSFFIPEHRLSDDERAKINLINALYATFKLTSRDENFELFITQTFNFYQDLKVGSNSFFNKILTVRKTSTQLEKLIDSRVYLNDNVFSKTFNRIIINSLLCIDVLLFHRYILHPEDIRKYAELLEYLTINITYHALNSKTKSKSNERLANLFASSLSFIDSHIDNYDGSYRKKLWHERKVWENQYLLDIACMTIWEDNSLTLQESEFIFGLGQNLGFSNQHITESLESTTTFFRENAMVIPFLKNNNTVVQFYDSMVKVVDKLILRNNKRLLKELSESKELVYLLSKSTVKDLTKDEKIKVQNQLMDVFKSIPSLAIFILPGGAILLPLFIKLIPKLLPSAFDENRID